DRGCSARRVSSSAGSRKTVSVCYAKDGSLPFSKHEARAVAKATDGELFEDQNATPRQVVAAMKNARYIHFACHGRFDEKEPLQSALELAPDPQQRSNGQETTSWSNGDLTLGEIFESVQLEKAPLVVL